MGETRPREKVRRSSVHSTREMVWSRNKRMGSHASSASSTKNGRRTQAESGEVRIVLDALRRIVQSLRASSRATEMRVGLSAAQLFVLLKLSGAEPLSINELAARTHTHQSSVSVVAGRLVERGLVARRRSSRDARRLELSLTRKGRSVLAKSPEAAQDTLVAAIEALPRDDRRALATTLDRLSRALPIEGAPSMLFEEARASRRGRNGRRNDHGS